MSPTSQGAYEYETKFNELRTQARIDLVNHRADYSVCRGSGSCPKAIKLERLIETYTEKEGTARHALDRRRGYHS